MSTSSPRLLRPLVLLAVALVGCASESSVRPGINADYTDAALDVDTMVKRFEVESREVFAQRSKIARAVDLQPGMAVADIGAGTGIFVDFFAKDVGPGGKVFAVDIAPKFVAHLQQRAATRGLSQVQAVLCTDRDTGLAPGSIDVAFVCDTYHHFEFPRTTLASIHAALRPGGRLCIVDFERIPGQSRQWILDHVRCGKDEVVREVEAAGFRLQPKAQPAPALGLQENYLLTFTRQ